MKHRSTSTPFLYLTVLVCYLTHNRGVRGFSPPAGGVSKNHVTGGSIDRSPSFFDKLEPARSLETPSFEMGLSDRAKATSTSLGLAMGGVDVGALTSSIFSSSGNVPLIQAFGINAALFAGLSQKLFTMLTPTGFAHSLALGTMLWSTLGWKGWVFCVSYLFLGQLVTKVKFEEKEKAGLAEGRGGRRGPENVWGSAATGLVCAACAVQEAGVLGFGPKLFLLGYVASLSTKLSDTFASEIGKAYGKTTFLITTLERVEPGTEGAISVEGTAASVVGGFLLSIIGYTMGLVDTVPAIAVSTFAAFVATNIESLLGATLQEKKGLEWITNEVINFLNTLIGAAIAMAMGKMLLGMA